MEHLINMGHRRIGLIAGPLRRRKSHTHRDTYLKALHAHIEAIEAGCRRLEIDYVRLRTDADLGHDLAAYLQKRHGR